MLSWVRVGLTDEVAMTSSSLSPLDRLVVGPDLKDPSCFVRTTLLKSEETLLCVAGFLE